MYVMGKITGNKGEIIIRGIQVGPLAKLIREKKTNMHFGSSVMSFKNIINITKKVPSLLSFIASIAFNDSCGV